MFSDIQHTLLPYLQHYGGYAGWIAFFASFFESLIGIGYFLPGSTIVLLMGVFAGQGFIDIKIVLFFAFLGAFAGDQSNYLLGKKYGETITKVHWIHLSQTTMKKAQRFLDSYGSVAVFFGRLLPGAKEGISFVAGTLKMRYYKFLFWELLGAFIWCLEFVGVGYFFSTSLSVAQLWLTRTMYIFVILTIFFIVIYLFISLVKQNIYTIIEIFKSFTNKILTHKKVAIWISNHPKTVNFIKNRFDKVSFLGMPLSLLAVAFLYILALFGGIVEDIISKDPIVAVDHIIANTIPAFRTPTLNSFFTYITLLGKTEIVVAFLLLTIVILWIYGKKIYIYPLLISTVGASISIYLSKLAFHRHRPDIAIYKELTYSFPSGHSTIAIALYGFIAYLIIHFLVDFQKKLNIFFIATMVILLIGISRIYLGEHYLSDVYSGYLLGTLWFIIGVAFSNWIEQNKKSTHVKQKRYTKFIATFVTIFFMLFFVIFSQLFHYAKMPIKLKKEIIVSSVIVPILVKNHFTQSLAGFNTWPINIIFIDSSLEKLKNHLQKAGWKRYKKSFIKSLPIYWNYKKANLFLIKHEKQKNYLLKIWRTNFLTLEKKYIFVATAIETDEYIWQMIPKFSQDIDNARLFVVDTLKKIDISKNSKMYNLNGAFIGEDILGNSYFSDGKCSVIYIKRDKL